LTQQSRRQGVRTCWETGEEGARRSKDDKKKKKKKRRRRRRRRKKKRGRKLTRREGGRVKKRVALYGPRSRSS
jgi:hypothetical protein